MIDRYSSTTLGRPFAIAEHEISVPFPAQVNDDELYYFNGTLDEIEETQGLNDMSVFVFYVRMRQITSRMHDFFTRAGKTNSPRSSSLLLNGQIHLELHKFLNELSDWRRSAPDLPEPTCLYYRPEWWDFMHERYRLLLVRAAIDAAPKQNGLPSKDLVDMIANSSTDVIFLYSSMFEKGQITYTRSYFQMLFTAGLSLMFSISAMGHFGEFKLQGRVKDALRTCEEVLMQISHQLQDSSYYTAIFEALHRETMRSVLVYQQFLTSSAPTRRGSHTGLESSQLHIPDDDLQNVNSHFPPHQAAPSDQTHAHELSNSQDDITFAASRSGNQAIETGQNLDVNPYYVPTFPLFDQYESNMGSLAPSENTTLQWGRFSDDWITMEAGLGEYAYGDPYGNSDLWDQLQMNVYGSHL